MSQNNFFYCISAVAFFLSCQESVQKNAVPSTAVATKTPDLIENVDTAARKPIEVSVPQPTNQAPITNAPTARNKPSEKQSVQKIVVDSNLQQRENTPDLVTNKVAEDQVFSHDRWNEFLKKYVDKKGKVNYRGIKNEKATLEAYLQELTENEPQNSWSRNEKMAYWINLYNAATVHLIVENYPISSILKLDGGKTWDVKRVSVGNRKYSLNEIENEILRPQFKDARIHFAVNCAAKSCPPLLNEAFLPEKLTAQLAAQTKKFVNNQQFNQFGEGEIIVSKIFDWYAADFGDLKKFLNQYLPTPIAETATIKFGDYVWDLNE